jgi:hypothetical protein
MGLFDVRSMVAITNGFPDFREKRKSGNLFSPEEIDALEERMFSGMSQEELISLRKKLSDTADELYADCDPGTPEWELWGRRMDRLDFLMDQIDEILEPEGIEFEEDDQG